jgi:glucose uptake protein
VQVALYALLTVVAWGTWIGMAQAVTHRTQQVKTFYVTLGNLGLAFVLLLALHRSPSLDVRAFWLPLAGGVVWALGSLCAFLGTANIGIARASGIWMPLNIGMGFTWGILLFGEVLARDRLSLSVVLLSIALIVAGILTIVSVRRSDGEVALGGRRLAWGLLGALGAGLLWGTYFVPIEASSTSLWVASFPLAVGMALGGCGLLVLGRSGPRLELKRDYALVLGAGVLWGLGNLGMLLLAGVIGTGRGFAIAQLSLLLNAAIGVYVFRDPKPGSRAALRTFVGIVLAGAGGVMLAAVR